MSGEQRRLGTEHQQCKGDVGGGLDGVRRLVSLEIMGIMKNSAGTSKKKAGHFLW